MKTVFKTKLLAIFAVALVLIIASVLMSACGGHTHKFGEWTEHEADCENPGWQERKCECGETEKQTLESKPALGHTEVIDEAKEATCLETGKTEGKHCSVCNKTLAEQTEIPAKGHTEVKHEAKAPTCTEKGNEAYVTCSSCDYTTFKELPAKGHTEVKHEAKAPTCTEKGNEAYVTCSSCDYTTFKEIPAKGHTEVKLEAVAAKCTADGKTEGKKCSVCNVVLMAQTVVPAKGHVCDEKVWEYNGTQHYRKCTVCSESYNFADHKITVGVCSCGYKIPVSECKHDYTLTLVSGKPATCTEDGVKEHYVCPYCNEWFEDAQAKNKITDRASVTLTATKHVEAVEKKAVSPTCYSVGYTEKVICAVCETVIKESVELPAAEHTAVTDAAVAPTCVTEGKTEGSHCSVCSAVLTAQTTVAATGIHEYEKTEEKAPTCTENGYISYKCKTCISVKDTSLAATGHSVSSDAEWTEVKGEDGEPILTPVADQKCVFEGTKVSACASCGGQVSEKYTTVKHSYIGKITQASTCQAEGVKTYTCSVCEAQYTESVAKDANAHSWTAQPTDGKYTCTVNGCGSTKVVVDHTDKTTAGIDKDTLNGAKDNDLEVNLKDATIKIDSSIVNELGEKGDEVDLSADKLDDGVRNEIISNIDEATKELIGDKPIYDFNLTVNDQKVIFEGNMTVTLPYDLKEGEDTESIVVAYISDDGKVELIPAAYTEIGGKGYVTFVTDHFSHFTTAQVEGSVRCQVYGHEYYEVKVQATCLTSGYTTRFCHYCGESDPEIYDVVAANGHNYKYDETASTCIAQGYVTSTCLDCGYTVVNGYTDFADHKFVISETVEPSCISEGYSIENCSVCGYSRKSAFVALLMHEFGDAEVTKAPTCTEAGELTAKCIREGCDAKKVTLSSPAGHVLTAVPGVSPTCTEAGAAGGIGCAVCNELLVQGEVIPAAGHTEQTIAKVDPTCTEAGKTEGKVCSVCGEILQAVADIAPVGHKEVTDAAIEATCVKPGLTEGKHCSVCNATIVQQTETPLKSHTFDDKYDTSCNVCGFIRDAECAHKNTETLAGVSPTCTKAGLSEGKKCADCGETLAEQTVIEVLGHKEEILPAVEPTCTESGKTEGKYCTVCNATLTEQTVIEALGHKEEILPAVEPTCTESGKTEGKYCSVCNETLAEQTVIEALGHKEEILPAVEPTCTEAGKTEGKYCSVCNATLAEQTVVEALGHKEEILPAVEPTCTEAGKTDGKYCTVCNETLAEQTVIEALGHKEIFMPKIEPTCAKVGFSAGAFCEVCKETLVERVVIAQLPHDYYDVAGLEPTCESSGWTPHKVCNECGHKDGYEVLRQLIHIEKAVSRVYPTCTEAGLEKYIVCELCGIYITEPVVIPALGHAYVDGACVRCGEKDPSYECKHEWSEWERIQESTCQIKGEDMRRCLICGEEEFKYYPFADHWMIKIQIIEPTCTKDGFIERECNWCKTLTQEYTKSLGHSFIDGICGRCG
ncbi:MAG: hypothetical protein E7634_06775, partial [Ruminococcaceae bacterium]|nr:hypothetical protein [Oscillospiraceae bacterium]